MSADATAALLADPEVQAAMDRHDHGVSMVVDSTDHTPELSDRTEALCEAVANARTRQLAAMTVEGLTLRVPLGRVELIDLDEQLELARDLLTLRAVVAAQAVELAALREDTARLDWLEAHMLRNREHNFVKYDRDPLIPCTVYQAGDNDENVPWRLAEGNDLRSALTAARLAERAAQAYAARRAADV